MTNCITIDSRRRWPIPAISLLRQLAPLIAAALTLVGFSATAGEVNAQRQKMYKVTYSLTDHVRTHKVNLETVVERITSFIAPLSWDIFGGEGTISSDTDQCLLPITNSSDAHRELPDYLIHVPSKRILREAIARFDLDAVKRAVRKNKELLGCSYRLTEYDDRQDLVIGYEVARGKHRRKYAKYFFRGSHGASLLHVTAALGDADTIKFVLRQGGDADATDSKGRTALFYASSPEVARLLLQAQSAMPKKDSSGRTPVFYARGQAQLRLLVDAGFHAKERARLANETPIHVAARLGHTRGVVALLKMGNDINAVDSEAHTALDEACMAGKSRTAVKLLQMGAKAIAGKDHQYTLLHRAVDGRCSDQVLAVLLKAGVDVNNQDNSLKESPLHVAARIGNVPATRFLLRNGAHVDVKNSEGDTPIRVAGSIAAYSGDGIAFTASPQTRAEWRSGAERKIKVFRLLEEVKSTW